MSTPPAGPIVTYSLREVLDRIEDRIEALEKSAARQATVKLSVLLSVISGPGAAYLTWMLTSRH